MELCPYCMRPAEGERCSHCGKTQNYISKISHLPLGTTLRNDEGKEYLIGAALGQGGFGITYTALSMKDNQLVAIKECFPHIWVERMDKTVVAKPGQEKNFAYSLERFVKEAAMLAGIKQLPSVVKILDRFQGNGTAYFVMEYVEGKSLKQIIKEQGKIPAEDFLPMLPKLLDDLEVLHSVQIFHRDISPDNIILMPNGQLKLLDFGSARVKTGDALTGFFKEGFSPIELYVSSKNQGAFTDVYSLCATIYYCLTGTVTKSALERLNQPEDNLVLPNALGVDLTERQEKALVRGLGIQPVDRWQSLQTFRQGFGPFEVPKPAVETEQEKEQDKENNKPEISKLNLEALKNPKFVAAAAAAVAALALLLRFFAGL